MDHHANLEGIATTCESVTSSVHFYGTQKDGLAQSIRAVLAENAALRKCRDRLHWLHRAGPNDAAGCDWGIFRVLWDGNGQPVAVSQTLSDFSDLDAEMQRNP